jgi:hypothetical protein
MNEEEIEEQEVIVKTLLTLLILNTSRTSHTSNHHVC